MASTPFIRLRQSMVSTPNGLRQSIAWVTFTLKIYWTIEQTHRNLQLLRLLREMRSTKWLTLTINIVIGQVTFSDWQDSEIQSMCLDESKPWPNEWQMPDKINLDSTSFKKINRNLTHACLVLFLSVCAIGAELKRGVHPYQVLATSSSKWAGGNDSTQSCGLQQTK